VTAVQGPDICSCTTPLFTPSKTAGALEIEERLAPRGLTDEQIHLLQGKLGRFARQSVEISYLIGDVESQTYANEFAGALRSIGRAAGLGSPSMFNFAGLAIRVQDPTDVPEAAEAMAEAIEVMGIPVQRIHTSNRVEINGNRPSRGFDLYVSKKGERAVAPRRSTPLSIPRISETAARADVGVMPDKLLVVATREFASAMRGFEASNREQLAHEWRVQSHPIMPGSYRYVFEEYRMRAVQIRNELLRRSAVDKASLSALDADTLAGVSPITDAANYLDTLAVKLAELRK
jgi:hypothetical protein